MNFAPNVKAGQLVARRTPPTPGAAGKDVKGKPLPANEGQDRSLQAGDNVGAEMEGKMEQFYATSDGALRSSNDELFVVERLTIKGDVSFNTGNLDFEGEIYVDGSVVQGFSVKAGGAITIADTVESGATVASQEDITVGKGIVGRRTKIVAGGNVRAQFVQEATVRTGKDIVLGNYAYHAHLRAGGRIAVFRGIGTRGGSIMGGQSWARQGMETHIAGTRTGTPTTLTAGLDPEQAQ